MTIQPGGFSQRNHHGPFQEATEGLVFFRQRSSKDHPSREKQVHQFSSITASPSHPLLSPPLPRAVPIHGLSSYYSEKTKA